ncbi:hypothetical protein [Botrimarina mediterranea]|uniref:hypothetical protein n=1 Tax=Botrimarina mediterranea TaxID=2528022 RepID=UPI0018D2E5CD|nr:hypothetical protein [Botrimarina mediterranea]
MATSVLLKENSSSEAVRYRVANGRISDGGQRDLGDDTLGVVAIGRVDGDLHFRAVFLPQLDGANLPNFAGVIWLSVQARDGPGDGGLGEPLGLALLML